MKKTYPFELQKLSYEYNALEPYFDEATMILHHQKHHQTYVNNLNAALEAHSQFHNHTLEDLLKNLNTLPAEIQNAVRNNGGGVFNHNLFFDLLTANSTKKPVGELAVAIDKKFGSFEKFKELFKKAGLGRFGSGWAWLVLDKNNELQIVSTPNQDVPENLDVKILLGLDVWEHAYYLKYQNRRAEFIDNFFEIIDWNKVNELFIK